MKFCRSTLFEACSTLFMKPWVYIRGKQAWFWQLNPYFNSFRRIWRTYGRQVSRKTLAKSLAAWDSRRLHEENQLRFSNSKDFRFYWAKKHSISEWYFTMRLGVLTLNNRETHVRIVSLDQLGSRRAIADLFVMFISWTSQKASKVHKLLCQSWP